MAHLFADNLQDGDVRAESPLESEESSSSDEMIFDSPRKPSSSSRERSSTTDEPSLSPYTKWRYYLFYLQKYFSGTVLPKSFTGAFSSNSRLDVREV